jgi:hypothetical protein
VRLQVDKITAPWVIALSESKAIGKSSAANANCSRMATGAVL